MHCYSKSDTARDAAKDLLWSFSRTHVAGLHQPNSHATLPFLLSQLTRLRDRPENRRAHKHKSQRQTCKHSTQIDTKTQHTHKTDTQTHHATRKIHTHTKRTRHRQQTHCTQRTQHTNTQHCTLMTHSTHTAYSTQDSDHTHTAPLTTQADGTWRTYPQQK